MLKHIQVRHGDLAAGFAAADVVVERTYRTPMTEHAFLEPECSVGVPAGWEDPRYGRHDKLTIYVGSQIPYADRDQVVILAEAERDAQSLRGQGDADAARLYGEAANRDPAFYAFQRSLEAYRASFKDGQGVIVLDKDDPFLQYMRSDR